MVDSPAHVAAATGPSPPGISCPFVRVKPGKERLVTNHANVVLEVSDQGRGMPKELLERAGNRGSIAGVGLAGMRERVCEVGGDFRLQSGPEGTSIRVSIPMNLAA